MHTSNKLSARKTQSRGNHHRSQSDRDGDEDGKEESEATFRVTSPYRMKVPPEKALLKAQVFQYRPSLRFLLRALHPLDFPTCFLLIERDFPRKEKKACRPFVISHITPCVAFVMPSRVLLPFRLFAFGRNCSQKKTGRYAIAMVCLGTRWYPRKSRFFE